MGILVGTRRVVRREQEASAWTGVLIKHLEGAEESSRRNEVYIWLEYKEPKFS